MHGTLHAPSELAARTLSSLKRDAERVGGKAVTLAVVGLPAGASEGTRAALLAAGKRVRALPAPRRHSTVL